MHPPHSSQKYKQNLNSYISLSHVCFIHTSGNELLHISSIKQTYMSTVLYDYLWQIKETKNYIAENAYTVVSHESPTKSVSITTLLSEQNPYLLRLCH